MAWFMQNYIGGNIEMAGGRKDMEKTLSKMLIITTSGNIRMVTDTGME
jgi:hypothetical protein